MSAPHKRSRLWLGGIALAILVVASLGARTVQQRLDGPWLEVQRQDLVLSIPFEGELEAVDSVRLGPPTVSRVGTFKISLLAPEGKEVRVGQPVLGFDTSDIKRRLQQRMTDRDSAEKSLEKAAQDLDARQRDLELRLAEAEARFRKTQFHLDVPEQVVSRRELEEAKIDRRLAQLEIDQLRANLDGMGRLREIELANVRSRRDRAARKVVELQEAIAAMTIKAPRSGTVIYSTNWRDEKSKVGDQVWRSVQVMEIPDLSQMRAEAEVAESDAGRLEVGQAATLYLDAYPDREYRGTLTHVRRAVQAKTRRPAEKVVKVQIQLQSTDTERMRPGMRLQGQLEVERLPEVVTVPGDAVFSGPEGVWVWKRTLWGSERRALELGRRGGDSGRAEIQVLSGLEPGDRVLGRAGRHAEGMP